MKPFKIIIACVLALLLSVLVITNVLLLCDYRLIQASSVENSQVQQPNNIYIYNNSGVEQGSTATIPDDTANQPIVDNQDTTAGNPEDQKDSTEPNKPKPTPDQDIIEEDATTDTTVPNESEKEPKLFYQDEYIKIIYMYSDANILGPTYKFKIENISDRSLTIRFSDVYIDGYQTFISGLTCSDLLPGMKAIEELYLMEYEWEDFTDSPSEISFVIEIVNPKSYSTIHVSERIDLNDRI